MLFIFFTGVAIGITGAMIPGPLTIFTVAETLRTDKFAGLKTTLGHIISESCFVAVIFLGFHNFLTYKPFLLGVSIIGGSALIIMGILLFLKSKELKISDLKTKAKFDRGLIAGGFFFSLASPGFFIWWATIGVSTIVKALLFGFMGIVVLMLGHWLADLLWHGFLSYTVDKGKNYLGDKGYQNLMRIFSLALIILGIRFLPLS
jgi:threonine/homoserine/homoserine lactone efflux protein